MVEILGQQQACVSLLLLFWFLLHLCWQTHAFHYLLPHSLHQQIFMKLSFMLATAPSRSYPVGHHLYHMIRCVHVLFAQSTVQWLFPLTEQSSYTRAFCVCWNSKIDSSLSSRESSKQKESMSKLSLVESIKTQFYGRGTERRGR